VICVDNVSAANSLQPEPLRRLGALERAFYSHGLRAQVLFSIIAEVVGSIDEEQLANALDALKQRHPFLSVAVVDTAADGLIFVHSDKPIEFTFVDAVDSEPWTGAVAAELNRWEKLEGGALARVKVVRYATRFTIIVTLNHTIADGRGSVEIINDLIQLLGGRSLSKHEGLPLLDDFLLKHPASGPLQLPDFLKPTFVKSTEDRPVNISTLTLDRDKTSLLIKRCRDEGVTVHGVLCAAATIATAGKRQGPLRLSSPVDLRATVEKESNSQGVIMALALAALESQEGEDMWSLARRALDGIALMKTRDVVSDLVSTLNSIVPKHGDFLSAREILPPLALDLMISNLGTVSVEATAGDLRVEAVWGPALNTQIDANDVVGVATFDGMLRLIHVHSTRSSSLLNDICEAIETRLLQ
jgi:NRPS condensation-like uncharacterized protein